MNAAPPPNADARVGATGGVSEPQLHFELRRGKKAVDPRGFLSPAPSAEAAATALKLATELENPPALNKNNLHPYRLNVKELRNVLQLADDSGNQAFIDTLGEVKDAIGEWHDWEELIAIATDLLDHGPGCKLLQQLKTISAGKYDRALALANKLRKDFLSSSRFRKQSLPRPLLQATAAIAS